MSEPSNAPESTAQQKQPKKKLRLDRSLQLRVLNLLADINPRPAFLTADFVGARPPEIASVRSYLVDHGLITSVQSDGPYGIQSHGYRITAKGLDFLEDDGGLTAVLGVLTVRLHDDTIKALVAAKIHEADLPEPEKKRYLDQLRELPAETTKHLVLKLVDLGLEQGPKAIETIGKWLT